MALNEFIAELDGVLQEATAAFAAAADNDALEEARVAFLGAKKGRLRAAQKGMGGVDADDRPQAGQRLNDVKRAIETAFEEAERRIATGAADAAASGPAFDRTLPGSEYRVGSLHPITQTIEELKDIMGRLGFTVADGPEIEDERHNFEALNIPREHPARDPLDNFYLSTAEKTADGLDLLMRSQTSTVQIRVMEHTPPPVRIISLGRVYRPDEADRTHYPMFHQMEGLMVDEGVTMADLKSVLRMFASSYLGSDVRVRFRPSFFPFTEPSVEADFEWNGEWIEFGGAGMVDPNVFTAVGYDPESVTGFAFGLGVERLCMRRHNLADIRDLFTNDVRFLRQF
ncbi:MAG: phenylalanine--tRNA ligase subunit alpha [Pirellulaceae bacterium]|jgi:phenylalanyl-tRNA synthetase alpha chain|nr:phenylalanine--tRNA ligase subunit alpha [Pirellulaceae bacterium]MDP7017161.1 phenylalanine--tRNA ligase subunit alpha [Pirellulaceae bacterium]